MILGCPMVVFQFTWRYIQKYLVQYVLFFLLVFITGLLGLISPIINGKPCPILLCVYTEYARSDAIGI